MTALIAGTEALDRHQEIVVESDAAGLFGMWRKRVYEAAAHGEGAVGNAAKLRPLSLKPLRAQ